MRTPALLAILDGVGISAVKEGNALALAKAPFLHRLFADTSGRCRCLAAAGPDVGLPEGQMGNSEVGHLNIGAGRVVEQELTRIDTAISDGSINQNQALLECMESARQNLGTLHLLGLVSEGGVHSRLEHLCALLALAAANGNKRIRVHALLDGRDVAPTSGVDYIRRLDDFCAKLVLRHMGLDLRVGTIAGRYYAMDRDQRWQRIQKAWRALVVPYEPDVRTAFANDDPVTLVRAAYLEGQTDEFVEPLALGDDGINSGDSLIFFNFRPDRARELSLAFIDPAFDHYAFRRPIVPNVSFLTLTEYDPTFAERFGVGVAFEKRPVPHTLADHLAFLGLRQLHIAETEKYAHVTFFLNGGIEEPRPGEERILIPSPKVATYDLQPQMSAPELTRTLVTAIEEERADVYIVNYANGDMVGHSGVLPAAISAIEAVDSGLQAVVEALLAQRGVGLITADHGNSEKMLDDHGQPWTAHTSAPVPLALVGAQAEAGSVSLDCDVSGRLADIAPTLLDLMELPIPSQFSGRSLLRRH
ncbi:MAG: 2,3-bisphosphoglycerate-independent phosphoglycerate mutase [Coriobacteriales bacterium]|jgi:2,3-bisphosphoglycerate-independent phosphoglycerate mutase|nr:2,3-bisphosphoglycerate-independent phosphoglycerate mutase [Coriobacteriales bacterium]